MGAPKKNEFWKLRSKHGRSKLFEDPEALWEAACEYFEWCEDNPLREERVVNHRTGPKIVYVNKLRAFTISGLALYLNANTAYFRNFERQIRLREQEGKEKPTDKDFNAILTRIKDTIFTQKFEGAAADQLNANIIARDLGLADKIRKEGETTKNKKLTIEVKQTGAAPGAIDNTTQHLKKA